MVTWTRVMAVNTGTARAGGSPRALHSVSFFLLCYPPWVTGLSLALLMELTGYW